MNKLCLLLLLLVPTAIKADNVGLTSPNGRLQLQLNVDGHATYSVTYDGRSVLLDSPLGFVADVGDFSQNLKLVGSRTEVIDSEYDISRTKTNHVHYVANQLLATVSNARGERMTIDIRLSDNDIALRYELPRMRRGETGSVRIFNESTGFRMPSETTTFLTPQSDAMIGWKRTKPSYEEVYKADAAMTEPSQYGHGYTFPCLFKVGGDQPLWVLVSETGVDSRYCASHLSEYQGDGLYTIAFPLPEENNGNGTVEPAFSLPGVTPWRTITVGTSLAPIVETTAPFDNVEPRYTSQYNYKYGKSTWSWIVWQDNSMNYDDQVAFIDLAATLGYPYILIDAGWDQAIGKQRMETLIRYAQQKGVDVFLWFSSSGYWNDIVQSPINAMDNSIARKEWMRWMQSLGVRGIKVDFWGGDKQETMRLYEQVFSDADDHGLMVIVHGCTLPRGWERMYPNYVGSEAVLASENLVFEQKFCDNEAFNACLHPFIRNTVGSMEWGGTFLNRRLSRGNKSGTIRRTTDCFELATAILYQNAIQNFAITPENLLPDSLGGAPEESVDFMRSVPTTWDETRFIDGYPGRYVVLARRHADTWYIAGVNAEKSPKTLTLDLSRFIPNGSTVCLYTDNLKNQDPVRRSPLRIKNPRKVKLTLDHDGGFVMTVTGSLASK